MGSTNYVDHEAVPHPVQQTIGMLASKTAHLARLLKATATPACPRADWKPGVDQTGDIA